MDLIYGPRISGGRQSKSVSDQQRTDQICFGLFDKRMEPAIPAGAIITFDRRRSPRSGEVVAVVVPSEGYDIGRYHVLRGRRELRHDNPSYPLRKIAADVRVIGTMTMWAVSDVGFDEAGAAPPKSVRASARVNGRVPRTHTVRAGPRSRRQRHN
jgi:hypothetical protein